ncbi:hypothetical protein K435DRAFT_799196 [Dendrothele bispora CBS 962.96]|uniref:Uncharacterized protein n=1 Tax=Dendrothele bispora (strain CBS 962.96) TaxID=1314807 RepID=A0A4S8LXC1_DENBC|nr:hypothetical protein K435DRAFT_799196 [Dendrothele bispora CBS 962.96]
MVKKRSTEAKPVRSSTRLQGKAPQPVELSTPKTKGRKDANPAPQVAMAAPTTKPQEPAVRSSSRLQGKAPEPVELSAPTTKRYKDANPDPKVAPASTSTKPQEPETQNTTNEPTKSTSAAGELDAENRLDAPKPTSTESSDPRPVETSVANPELHPRSSLVTSLDDPSPTAESNAESIGINSLQTAADEIADKISPTAETTAESIGINLIQTAADEIPIPPESPDFVPSPSMPTLSSGPADDMIQEDAGRDVVGMRMVSDPAPGVASATLPKSDMQEFKQIDLTRVHTLIRKGSFKPGPLVAKASAPPKPPRPVSPLPISPPSPVRSSRNARTSVPPSDPLDGWDMRAAMDDYDTHEGHEDYLDIESLNLPRIDMPLDDHLWVYDENDIFLQEDGYLQQAQYKIDGATNYENDEDEGEEEEREGGKWGGIVEGEEEEKEDGEWGGIADEGKWSGIAEDEEWGGIAEDEEWGGIAEDEEWGGIVDDGEWGGIADDGEWGGIADDDGSGEAVEDDDEGKEEERQGYQDNGEGPGEDESKEGGGSGEDESEEGKSKDEGGEEKEREEGEEDEYEDNGEGSGDDITVSKEVGKVEALRQYKAGRDQRRQKREQGFQPPAREVTDDLEDPPLQPKRRYGKDSAFRPMPRPNYKGASRDHAVSSNHPAPKTTNDTFSHPAKKKAITKSSSSHHEATGSTDKTKATVSSRAKMTPNDRAGKTKEPAEGDDNGDVNIDADVNTGDEEDEVDDFTGKSKSGPIPEQYRREAFEAANLYDDTLKKIARKAGKPVQVFYRLVGQRRWMPCGPNYWNMAQQYITDPEGGNETKPQDVDESEIVWKRRRWEEMRKEALGDDWQDNRLVKEAFSWLQEWFENRYQENAQPSIMKGLSERGVRRIADDFVTLADHAAKNRGVCCLGYVLDYHGNHSIMWGAGSIYERMRDMYDTQIDQQIKDLVAQARGAYMKERDGDSAMDPDYMDFLLRSVDIPPKSKRDAHRSFIAEYLRYSLSLYDKHFDWKSQRFPWQKFADVALTHQIRIENWSDVIPPPGNGLKALKSDAYTTELYDLSCYALRKIQWEKSILDRELGGEEEDELDPEIDNKALRIVAWTDGNSFPSLSVAQKSLSSEQLGDVPLVVSVSGRTLCTGKNARSWMASGAPANAKGKAKAGKKGQDTKFSGDRSKPRLQSHSPSHSPSRPASRPASPVHSRLPSPTLQFASYSSTRGRSTSRARSPLRERPRSRSRSLYDRHGRRVYPHSPSQRGREYHTGPKSYSLASSEFTKMPGIVYNNDDIYDNLPKPPRRKDPSPAYNNEDNDDHPPKYCHRKEPSSSYVDYRGAEHPAGTSSRRGHQASHEDPRPKPKAKRPHISWEEEYQANHRDERPKKKKRVEYSNEKNDARATNQYGAIGKGKKREHIPAQTVYRNRKYVSGYGLCSEAPETLGSINRSNRFDRRNIDDFEMYGPFRVVTSDFRNNLSSSSIHLYDSSLGNRFFAPHSTRSHTNTHLGAVGICEI